ncbi:MAG: DMT family transporter [Termitinemataceae bacterium]|nr:MAG: DMT family transporter [Termitinemataceae bacterium]
MDKKIIRADLLLLLVACIWGFAFSAQRVIIDYVGPFTFNAIRFFLGALVLVPVMLIIKNKKTAGDMPQSPHVPREDIANKGNRLFKDVNNKTPLNLREAVLPAKTIIKTIIPPLVIGFCLFMAASLQQVGLFWTTAGKSGFITGLYVVFVPIVGILLHRKTGKSTWIGAVLTFCGLFFVAGIGELLISSIKTGIMDTSTINFGDLLTVISVFFWTSHVLFIDYYLKDYKPVTLAFGQFMVCSFLSLLCALLGISTLAGVNGGPELVDSGFNLVSLIQIVIPILYGGLCSVGIANTLQVVAQKDAPPAHAAILMSLETVFAAVGGFLILDERPTHTAMLGFGLMLIGMLATQWDVIWKKKL